MRYWVKDQAGWTCSGLVLALLAISGCAAPYTYYCDDGCGPNMLSGRYGSCGGEPCATCEGSPDDPFCGHTVSGVLRNMLTCGGGCGDIYLGEWSYDPPDQCDPCNNHGDWTGPQCCPPSCWTRFWEGLHGGRSCGTTCQPTCGCDTCDTQDMILDGAPYEMTEQPQILQPMPTPAASPADARSAGGGARSYFTRHPNSRLVRRANQ